ncbi:MAG: hypothetical protein KatS3mg048_2481 [Caldilinea sp.]|jgi:hypothetical protein|nr:MAG: hypothetical protein KatS3mg048_2481 [Caldilinea sp.]
MSSPIKLFDVVALTVDLPEYNLRRGQVGTVVEILAGGEAFEVDSVIVRDARMNPWVCGQSNLWFCTMSLSMRLRSLWARRCSTHQS